MPDVEAEILTVLEAATPVWVPVAALPGRIPDHAPECVLEAAKALETAGLISGWAAAPSGPSILLSPLSVERLGLMLLDDHDFERSRWIAVGQERAIRTKRQQSRDPDGPQALDDLADPCAREPIDLLILSEAMWTGWNPEPPGHDITIRDGPVGRWQVPALVTPKPRIVLGSNVAGWSLAHEDPAGVCLCCGGRVLSRIMVCLGCLKSGVDHLLPKVSKLKPSPKGGPRAKSYRPDGSLKGGLGGPMGKRARRRADARAAGLASSTR